MFYKTVYLILLNRIIGASKLKTTNRICNIKLLLSHTCLKALVEGKRNTSADVFVVQHVTGFIHSLGIPINKITHYRKMTSAVDIIIF